MQLSQRTYKVYIHTNKFNSKKYVGITRQKPERRWQKGKGYAGTYFGNAIIKYGWDNFSHEVILTDLTREEACDFERRLIKQLRTVDRRFGYNISEGGQLFDTIQPKRGIEHHHHSRVKMINPKTMAVIRVFDTQSEAAAVMGINRKGITKACVGVLATYKGYIWEYADRDFQKPEHVGCGNYKHDKVQKKIYMIDEYGMRHNFNSVKEASEITGVSRSNISRYLKGLRKDTRRRWCYEF